MNRKQIYPNWMLIVPLIMFILFFVIPSTIGYFYAFTDWNSYFPDVRFIGFANFIEILQNKTLGTAFFNTMFFAFGKTILVTILGFAFALILNRQIHSRNIIRTIFFMPAVLSTLVVGLIFSALFDANNGVINKTLITLGLENLTQAWLGERIPALFTILTAEVWRNFGYAMVITLAGLQTVPSEYIEAALVDGANEKTRFFKIILPLIMPTVNVNILYSLIYGLKMFDLVYVLTKGGPGFQTETFGTLMINEMARGRYGQSVAINLIFTVILVIAAFSYQRYASKWEEITS